MYRLVVLFLLFAVNHSVFSQDSIYVMNDGFVIGKYAVSEVDSIVFKKPEKIIDTIPPSISLTAESEVLTVIEEEDTAWIRIKATAGTGDIASLTLKDHYLSYYSSIRLLQRESPYYLTNPTDFEVESGSSRVWEIGFISVTDPGESETIIFIVTDEFGKTAEVEKEVFVQELETPLTLLSGDYKLFSTQGPFGYGGLILSDGTTVGTANGDLVDLATSTPSWNGSFKGNTGITVKKVDSDYFELASQENVAAIYSAASEYDQSAPEVGDVFIVYDGAEYYVLKVIVNDGYDSSVSLTNGQYIQFLAKK
jgi:hypothetical protein